MLAFLKQSLAHPALKSSPRARRLLSDADRAGLTLVELAIVILVIGIIMTIVVMNLDFSVVDKGKILAVKSQRMNLMNKLKIYEMENPPLNEGDDLGSIDGVNEEMLNDPWSRPYFICRADSGQRHICSYGADGEQGGEGENQDFYLTGNPKEWPAWLRGKKEGEEEEGL
ncbi:MAG: type II secretion system protein GspG [Leptospiraceae bacterium]|nr:type II secretion system protein GspG [Leptospiraceae bacterium]